MLGEQLHRIDIHGVRRAPERRRAFEIFETAVCVAAVVECEIPRMLRESHVRIGTGLEQRFQHHQIRRLLTLHRLRLRIAGLGRPLRVDDRVQRRHRRTACDVGIGFALEQLHRHIELPVDCGQQKRRRMVNRTRVVDLCATIEQRNNRAETSLSHRVMQRRHSANRPHRRQIAGNAAVDGINDLGDGPLGLFHTRRGGTTRVDRCLHLRGSERPLGHTARHRCGSRGPLFRRNLFELGRIRCRHRWLERQQHFVATLRCGLLACGVVGDAAHCRMNRRVRATLEQRTDGVRAVKLGGENERRLPPLDFACVDIGTGRNQRFNRLCIAGFRREMKRGCATRSRRLHIAARFDQCSDDIGIP